MKCIEDEIPFELPEGWAWCRLNSIASIELGKTLDAAKNTGDYKPYLRSVNVHWNVINLRDINHMKFEPNELARYSIKKGDLLICEGGDVGRSCVWENDKEIYYQNALHRVRFYMSISPYFYMYTMMYYSNIGKLQEICKGVTIKHLTRTALLTLLFPVPPKNESTNIANKILKMDSLLQDIECNKAAILDLVASTKSKILDLAIRGEFVPQDPDDEPASVLMERIRAKKEELIKQGKIKRDKNESIIFRGDDNSYYEKIGNKTANIDDQIPFDLPQGWAFIRLKAAWELISGRDLSPSEYNNVNNGIPYITGASNLENGQVNLVRWTPVPQVFTYNGDLLLTCKGTIGKIAFNNFGEAHIARQIMAIRNTYSLNIEFLALCIQYSAVKIKQAAKGLIPGISRDDILNLIIPIPPEKQQEKIVRYANTYFEKINAISRTLN